MNSYDYSNQYGSEEESYEQEIDAINLSEVECIAERPGVNLVFRGWNLVPLRGVIDD